jgi:Homeodomain-like domain-containing protein
MVYRHISADMKCRALQLLAEGWELEIAGVLGVSERSVKHWFDNYEVHGRVDPPSVNQGRRRLLTQDVIEDLQELLLETPDLYLDKIMEWLLLYHDLLLRPMGLNFPKVSEFHFFYFMYLLCPSGNLRDFIL